MCRWRSVIPAVATLTVIGCATPLTAIAQIVPDNTLGSENSVVTPNVNIRNLPSDRIDGGAVRGGNLFHSFQEFNVDVDRGVYFSNPDSIVNILTRVTGDNISNILGTLGVLGNANLFLINPNGIVFGPNARLDVGGSFFASTADGILFENGVEFAASNPEAPPLLTINIPLGLNIRENPGTIVNQSVAVDSEDNLVGLQVSPRRTLGFVGGDIRLEGGILTAPQGRIELGSVAGNNLVSLTPIAQGYAVGYENVQNFQDIVLSQGASVNVLGGSFIFDIPEPDNSVDIPGNGDIQVQAQRLLLTEGSDIVIGTLGLESAGNLTVTATDVELIGTDVNGNPSGLIMGAFGGGDTGNIRIETERLVIQDGSLLGVLTFLGEGQVGDVEISASESVELSGTAPNGNPGGIVAATAGTGDAGNIRIETGQLVIRDGARLVAGTLNEGQAGNIDILASESVQLSGVGTNATPSELSANTQGAGDAGNIRIETGQLVIRDGAIIAATTTDEGQAGNIDILASESVQLSGIGTNATPSVLSANTRGAGDAGNIRIETGRLVIRDGSTIEAATGFETSAGDTDNTRIETPQGSVFVPSLIFDRDFNEGQTGNIDILASESVELSGTAPNGNPSSIVAGTAGTGDAGNIRIGTGQLVIRDGAVLGVVTTDEGQAGTVEILASESVELSGTAPNGNSTGIFAGTQATGDAGNVRIETGQLTVEDEARVVVSSTSFRPLGNSGRPGNVEISASEVLLEDEGSLNASSVLGQGGSIEIEANDVRLFDGGFIAAEGSQSGETFDGNIDINADLLVLLNRGVIVTDASRPSGGSNINIRPLTQPTIAIVQAVDSAIFAAGNLTIDSSITFQPAEIPEVTVVDPNDLIAQEFCRQRGTSQFTITGRGGLASTPNDIFTGDRTQVPLVEPVEPVRSSQNRSTSTQRPRTEPSQPRTSAAPRLRSGLNIIPARGWIRDENGDVILVSYDPTKTGVRRQPVQPPQCQP